MFYVVMYLAVAISGILFSRDVIKKCPELVDTVILASLLWPLLPIIVLLIVLKEELE